MKTLPRIAIPFPLFLLFLLAPTISSCTTAQSPLPTPNTLSNSSSQPSLSPNPNELFWLQFRQSLNTPQPYPSTDENQLRWMLGGMKKARSEFWPMCSQPNLQNFISFYVTRFGKEGGDADLAWILAYPEGFLPTHHVVPTRPSPNAQPKSIETLETQTGALRLQQIICEAQVRYFLENPRTFFRYYHAVIWYRCFLGSPNTQNAAFEKMFYDLQSFPPPTDPNYWLYARHFMLLAHATGRSDLLADATPEVLRERSTTWRTWLIGKNAPNIWEGTALAQLKADEHEPIWRFDPAYPAPGRLPPLLSVDRPFPDYPTPLTNSGLMEFTYFIEGPEQVREEIVQVLRKIGTNSRPTPQI